MVWSSKHQPFPCFNFETSEYVRRYLLCCLFPSKYVIFAVFGVLICNCISGNYLIAVDSLNTSDTACMIVCNCWHSESRFFCCRFGFQNVNRTFLGAWKPLHTRTRGYFMHFNLQKHYAYMFCFILISNNISSRLILGF